MVLPHAPPTSATAAHPEFVAVVLAATVGARLFPITSSSSPGSSSSPSSGYHPKHLLPLCGVPIVARLLRCLRESGFDECVVAVSRDDDVTLPALLREGGVQVGAGGSAGAADPAAEDQQQSQTDTVVITFDGSMKVTVFRLGGGGGSSDNSGGGGGGNDNGMVGDCQGSIEALRRIEKAGIIHPRSDIVVFPGDLVVSDKLAVERLVHAHRRGRRRQGRHGQLQHHCGAAAAAAAAACTILLSDVGEVDEHGAPLKESAKQKKGGLAREEEEIEYVALSYPAGGGGGAGRGTASSSEASQQQTPRVVWKQSKLDVEEDEDMVGSTPKLALPKQRLRGGITRVRTDWNDVHVYALSPWVRVLLRERKSLLTVQGDLIPLLVSRQYRGIAQTFGSNLSKADRETVEASLALLARSPPDHLLAGTSSGGHVGGGGGSSPRQPALISTSSGASNNKPPPSSLFSSSALSDGHDEYAVLAHVEETSSSVLRAHSIASYLHASKEFVNRKTESSQLSSSSARAPPGYLALPPKAAVNAKFHSLLLPDTQVGDKANFKSAVVGRNCRLGNKVRLNNVVIMDGVAIGDNTILQNCVVGAGCTIGENCNLNDCQVGPGKTIPPSTKEKGESFLHTTTDQL